MEKKENTEIFRTYDISKLFLIVVLVFLTSCFMVCYKAKSAELACFYPIEQEYQAPADADLIDLDEKDIEENEEKNKNQKLIDKRLDWLRDRLGPGHAL